MIIQRVLSLGPQLELWGIILILANLLSFYYVLDIVPSMYVFLKLL